MLRQREGLEASLDRGLNNVLESTVSMLAELP